MLVSVVDDDESVRESLPDLLRQFGFTVNAYDSAEAFLASGDLDRAACLILDIAMPGLSGPRLYQEAKRRGACTPVIFITAHGDAADRPGFLAMGAVDCLTKPFSEAALLAALAQALPGH